MQKHESQFDSYSRLTGLMPAADTFEISWMRRSNRINRSLFMKFFN